MRRTIPLAVAALAAALVGGSAAPASATAHRHHAPAVIHANGPRVFPHSGDFDSRTGTFYVGSLAHTTISAVSLNGAVRTVVDDPKLISVAAVRLDAARGRLLASDADYGLADRSDKAAPFHVAGVADYDLKTGHRLWYADLAAAAGDGRKHLISDVTLAPDGTAYAVDELSPTVFRIDRQGHATVLATGKVLAGTVDIPGFLSNVGMTAAAWMPGNYLLITEAGGILVRLPIQHPDEARQVRLAQPLAPLTAGFRVLPNGSLAVVSSGLLTGKPAQVQLVRGEGCWSRATVSVTDTVADPVTSDVLAGPGGTTYALSGGLAALLAGRPNNGFTLTRVDVG
ncbi:hypothetical protein [Streptomyces sp. NPDC004232]|uniref:hypothetical protein n=1 Tax=unclassified Streptomyces TaxID=2593676 RepID=UPI001E1AB397|nr:hypothetical protein [Streptomyces sp. tea 10]